MSDQKVGEPEYDLERMVKHNMGVHVHQNYFYIDTVEKSGKQQYLIIKYDEIEYINIIDCILTFHLKSGSQQTLHLNAEMRQKILHAWSLILFYSTSTMKYKSEEQRKLEEQRNLEEQRKLEKQRLTAASNKSFEKFMRETDD